MGKTGFGFVELLVVVALFLIFVRPDDMPRIIRQIGKIWAKVYYYITVFKSEIRKMEKEIGIEEEMKEIRAINARMNSEIANFNREIRDTAGEVKKPLPEKKDDSTNPTAKGDKDVRID